MAKPVLRTGHTTDLAIESAERQRKALIMRRDGKTFDQIARALGYSDRGSARNACMAALAEITKEPAEEVKKVALERATWLWSKARRAVITTGGEPAAISAAAKALERLSKLEGTDAPTQHQEVAPALMPDAALIAEYEAELERAKARVN